MYYGRHNLQHAASTQAQKEKTLFCAFEPDHYVNKLQSYLTLARARFYKGRLSRKVGLAAFRYLLYDASLDAQGSVLKKKMKLHETAGNEKIKQE